jgi:prepilin-type processing-associated H-X9-DG protein
LMRSSILPAMALSWREEKWHNNKKVNILFFN